MSINFRCVHECTMKYLCLCQTVTQTAESACPGMKPKIQYRAQLFLHLPVSLADVLGRFNHRMENLPALDACQVLVSGPDCQYQSDS